MKQRAIVAAPAFALHRFALVLAITLLAPLALAACQPAPTSAPRAAPPAGAPPTAGAPAQSGAVPSQPAAPAAASVPTPPAPPQPLKMAIPAKSLAFLPYFLGVEKGIFESEGILLEMPLMASNLAVASLTTGELSYTASTGSSIQAAVGGSPFKVVLFMLKDLAFAVMAAPEITSPADLRGKSIAISNLTATDDYAWRAAVRAHGVSPDEITAVGAQTTANSFAALTGGAVQAAVLSPPFDEQAERLGYRMLAWTADYLKRAQSGLVTTDKSLQERPAEVRRMVRATLRSMHYTLDHEADSVALITREFSVAPDLAAGTYQKIARVTSRDGEVAPEAVREEIEDTKARTGFSGDVPISQVMDLGPLRQVRAELGLP
jgi:ABC-type nitrate/sulfonate/bicarbonate transport system substrate-binding protein